MLHAIIAPRDDAIRICQYTIIFLKIIYCHLVIKSLDHEGWVKIFLPFPKGWRRVVATQRHLTEGAAGKTTLHQPYYPTGSEHQAFAVR